MFDRLGQEPREILGCRGRGLDLGDVVVESSLKRSMRPEKARRLDRALDPRVLEVSGDDRQLFEHGRGDAVDERVERRRHDLDVVAEDRFRVRDALVDFVERRRRTAVVVVPRVVHHLVVAREARIIPRGRRVVVAAVAVRVPEYERLGDVTVAPAERVGHVGRQAAAVRADGDGGDAAGVQQGYYGSREAYDVALAQDALPGHVERVVGRVDLGDEVLYEGS
mmetsp:Transcript_16493/g.50995  ORF Transcript_16493/g.50995 Transcript_16493/m.50995 type:complete len:223 (-) Transcript_16493:58-726(-)